VNKDTPLTGDQMALQRTVMASERTFMAWSRTALSFISFGFAIPKVLERIEAKERLLGDHGPKIFGITMILLGVFILAVSSLQHGSMVKRTRLDHQRSFASTGLSFAVALVLFVIGLLAVLSLALNIGPF
jgi:putative membrane protein